MEIHHSHNHGIKKNWKEYIAEFFMLFLAITLGFFAENIREKVIEKHREVSYLKNVHEDLLHDFRRIDTVIYQNTFRLRVLDSMFLAIQNGDMNNEDVYYYIRNLALRTTFDGSHIGFDQIKSAGGFRMIKNNTITTGIQEYETVLNGLDKLEELRERTLEQARFKMTTVFDPIINYQIMKQQQDGIMHFKRPNNADAVLSTKKEDLDELFNLIAIGLNTNNYINTRLTNLKKVGMKLDKAIIDEYGAEIEH